MQLFVPSGRRLRTGVVVVATMLLAAHPYFAGSMLLGVQQEVRDWPMAQFDLANTNAPGLRYAGTTNLEDYGIKWVYRCGEVQSGPLAIADMNADGKLEAVIVGDATGKVAAITLGEGVLWALDGDGVRTYTAPLLVDSDGDGHRNVIYGTEAGVVRSLDHQGRLMWEATAQTKANAQAKAIDIDGDGTMELVIGRVKITNAGPAVEHIVPRWNGFLEVWSPDGRVLWSYNQRQGTTDYAPAISDINNDGLIDLVGGRLVLPQPNACLDCPDLQGRPYMSILYAVSPEPGLTPNAVAAQVPVVRQQVEWITHELDGLPVRSPMVGDLDGDGQLEIVFAVSDKHPELPGAYLGGVFVVDGDGSIRASYAPSAPLYAGLAGVDMTGDGTMEIVIGTTVGIEVLEWKNGTLNLAFSTPTGPAHVLTAADLDGDGRTELVVGTRGWGAPSAPESAGGLVLVDDNGEISNEIPLTEDGITHLAIVDSDTDGDLEIVALSWNTLLYLFGDTGGALGTELEESALGGRMSDPAYC